MESHKRSIVKAMTWRVIASLITFLVAYLFTKELALSTGIGISDAAIKIGTYYSHERLWERISFGRKKESKEDYTI
jgi:adenylylsulfate kinase|tara:strand:+ start:227 stop:454 length:228 start_codon:yes stop_codon:yes gene_type:complete